ncbi:hypothetical protein SAMN05216548_108175 [Faunimonas pinastri]|uniref:Uncharacterized protein n=1 Tax=Faunimonas pinastri TaxID=1855383 RepID=A0A1H9JLY2_9HYPH|nr:hypothetical protein [Faunimonas pinastri]SEQ87753.1 hypothetical protein SAMN05216548_108175 [Faunimonas pinastri]
MEQIENEIVAWVLSDPSGAEIGEYPDREAAMAAGGDHPGWDVGVRLADHAVTFCG